MKKLQFEGRFGFPEHRMAQERCPAIMIFESRDSRVIVADYTQSRFAVAESHSDLPFIATQGGAEAMALAAVT